MIEVIKKLKKKKVDKSSYIRELSEKNNIQLSEFILQFISFLIFNKPKIISTKSLSGFEFIIHNIYVKEDYLLNYFVGELENLHKLL